MLSMKNHFNFTCNFFQVLAKIIGALTCLYFFICSLEFLSTSFRLLAGKQAGEVFSQSELLQNPIVGLMLGILVTVLLQSSSTTTSIIVGMVAGEILNVRLEIGSLRNSSTKPHKILYVSDMVQCHSKKVIMYTLRTLMILFKRNPRVIEGSCFNVM